MSYFEDGHIFEITLKKDIENFNIIGILWELMTC